MPLPRKKENKGLPARWRVARGAYYFRVPKGFEADWDGKQLFRLGKTLPAHCGGDVDRPVHWGSQRRCCRKIADRQPCRKASHLIRASQPTPRSVTDVAAMKVDAAMQG